MTQTVDVLWISRHPDTVLSRGYYDQALLEAIFDRSLWRPPGALTFTHHEVNDSFPDVLGAVVMLPARHHASLEDVIWLREQIKRLNWCLLILCGDEEWNFPWQHFYRGPHHRVWVMQPKPEHRGEVDYMIPGGWYPGTQAGVSLGRSATYEKQMDWIFAGQVTHARRRQCVDTLKKMLRDGSSGFLHETAGYLQGMPAEEYFVHLADAKVAPCPSGPMTVDTARPLEAMEAGCVPVVDTVTPRGDDYDYWSLCFSDDCPLPRISDWSTFPAVLDELLTDYPSNANEIGAWWCRWKRDTTLALDDDIRSVAEMKRELTTPDDLLTVIITTSPTPFHPSTEHLDITIESVRAQLPNADIVIAADGCRPEQSNRRSSYDEYLRRVVYKCQHEWHNVLPVLMPEWVHQANSVKRALEEVHTPLIVFMEHDTPLEGEIPWPSLCHLVLEDTFREIRFHFDPAIHPDHEHGMIDPEPVEIGTHHGIVHVRRTWLRWQRPHVTSTAHYRDRVMSYFNADSRSMIEDPLHSVVECAWMDNGMAGWDDWRIAIYTPEGGYKRSSHLDSRGADPKFAMKV